MSQFQIIDWTGEGNGCLAIVGPGNIHIAVIYPFLIAGKAGVNGGGSENCIGLDRAWLNAHTIVAALEAQWSDEA